MNTNRNEKIKIRLKSVVTLVFVQKTETVYSCSFKNRNKKNLNLYYKQTLRKQKADLSPTKLLSGFQMKTTFLRENRPEPGIAEEVPSLLLMAVVGAG